jgi:PASTA domain
MERYKSKKNNISFMLCFILSFVFLFLNFFPIMKPVLADESGGGIFCNSVYGGAIRPGVKPRILRNAEVLPELSNRTYTLEELYSSSLGLSEFYGENDGKLIFGKRDAGLSGQVSSDGQERIKNRGEDSGGCLTTPIRNLISSGILSMTSNINGMVSFLVTSLFDPYFPSTSDGGDSSLVKIIGGENEQGGIISSLASGIYYPLLGLAAIAAGVYLMRIGIFKRQFREVIEKLVWVFFALLFGVIVAIRPTTMTRLPHTLTATVIGCVVDAINGGNCANAQTGTDKSSMIDQVCVSDSASATPSQQAALNVNSLSCGIWKSLTLNSWSRAQFGYNFDELYTQNAPSGAKIYEVSNPQDFCISTHSSMNIKTLQNQNGEISFSGDEICNIAAAQLSIQGGVNPDKDNSLRNSIAAVAAEDPVMFNSWGYSLGNISSSLESLLGTVFALLAIVMVTIRGHMYSFLATITMAFAPLFALMAIDPGKGRRLFLGWVENLIGYIVKYISSAIMVLVTIMLFSALLTNMIGGFSTVVASLVLSLSMMSYQRQFVDYVSRTSFGGERVAQSLGDVMDSKLDKGTQALSTGSKLTSGALLGEKLSSIKNGTKSDYKRAITDMANRQASRSGNDLVRNTAQQMRRANNKYDRDVRTADKERKDALRHKDTMDNLNNQSDKAMVGISQLGENVEANARLNVTVPDLIGINYEQASNILKNVGLKLGSVTPSEGSTKGQTTESFSGIYESKGSDTYDVGNIIGQSENPGAKVQRNTAINITVYDDGSLNLQSGMTPTNANKLSSQQSILDQANENDAKSSENKAIKDINGNKVDMFNNNVDLIGGKFKTKDGQSLQIPLDLSKHMSISEDINGNEIIKPLTKEYAKYIEKFGQAPQFAPVDTNGKVLDGYYAMTKDGYKWKDGEDPNAAIQNQFFSLDGKSMSLNRAKKTDTKEYEQYLKRFGQEPLREPANMGMITKGAVGGYNRTSQGYKYNNSVEGNPTSTKLVIDNLKHISDMQRYGLDANLNREMLNKGGLTEADRDRIKQISDKAMNGDSSARNELDKNLFESQLKEVYQKEFANNPLLTQQLSNIIKNAGNGNKDAINALNQIDSVNESKFPKDGEKLTQGQLADIENQKAQVISDYNENPSQFSKENIGTYTINVKQETVNNVSGNVRLETENKMPNLDTLPSSNRLNQSNNTSYDNNQHISNNSQNLSSYNDLKLEDKNKENDKSRITKPNADINYGRIDNEKTRQEEKNEYNNNNSTQTFMPSLEGIIEDSSETNNISETNDINNMLNYDDEIDL